MGNPKENNAIHIHSGALLGQLKLSYVGYFYVSLNQVSAVEKKRVQTVFFQVYFLAEEDREL